jgi:hypothetical protein
MITPQEIKKKAERKYVSFLQLLVENRLFAKIEIRGDKSYTKSSLPDFEREIQSIISQSKEKKGFGYTLEFQQVKTKLLGIQDLPTSIYFDSEKDFLKFLGKEKEVELFKADTDKIIEKFPELTEWIVKNATKVIDNHLQWDNILKVCQYFKRTPKPNLYIRELPIEVHTKFIEQNKGILHSILSEILPQNLLNIEYRGVSGNNFEKRYNLNYDKGLIRFRILDADLFINGISDLGIRPEEFIKLNIDCSKVFITENLMNFLTFPIQKDAIVIWGEGNKVNTLKSAKWLCGKTIVYWGDIDTWGLQILSSYRSFFPKTISMLMTQEIFEKYYNYSTEEKEVFKSMPTNLTSSEKELFEFLLIQPEKNRRLEQEHIPLLELKNKLKEINAHIELPKTSS